MKSEQIKLSELGKFKNGLNFNRNDYGTGFPIINVKQLYKSRFATTENLLEIKLDFGKKIEDYFVKKGDLLFVRGSMKPEGAGQVVMINKFKEKTVFSGFIIRFRISDFEETNPLFLTYLLGSPKYREMFVRIASGSVHSNMTQEILANISVELPHIAIQNSVTKILNDIDTEIENIQNQNQILEQMVQTVFKSWFIDFEGITEWDDSKFGKIPKGWKIKQIKDFCNVRRGASPRPVGDPKYFGGNIPWIKIADVSKSPSPYLFSTKETVTEEGAKKSVHLPKNSLILSNSGTVGKPIFLTRDGCIHDGWLYFQDLKEISQEFLYFYILTLSSHLNLIGDGTVQKNLNTTIVGDQEFICPTKNHLDLFLKFAKIFLKTIKTNQTNVNALMTLRDELLPKLMSGEIKV